jgi:hypothetical protein
MSALGGDAVAADEQGAARQLIDRRQVDGASIIQFFQTLRKPLRRVYLAEARVIRMDVSELV